MGWCRVAGLRDEALSYRLGFSQHQIAELDGQVAWRHQIYSHAQQLLQFVLQAAQVKQRGARQSIYQQVEVTVFPVVAMQRRTEDARVRGTTTTCGVVSGVTVLFEGDGSAHSINSEKPARSRGPFCEMILKLGLPA